MSGRHDREHDERTGSELGYRSEAFEQLRHAPNTGAPAAQVERPAAIERDELAAAEADTRTQASGSSLADRWWSQAPTLTCR